MSDEIYKKAYKAYYRCMHCNHGRDEIGDCCPRCGSDDDERWIGRDTWAYGKYGIELSQGIEWLREKD